MTEAAHHFVPRLEDDALVRGRGRFADDNDTTGVLHGCFVRSPQAHARIRAIDVADLRTRLRTYGAYLP